METKTIKASELTTDNKIVFVGAENKKVVIGQIDKIYQMVDNQIQCRFVPGSCVFSAITLKKDEDVMVTV